MRPFIVVGDKTDHGGVVLQGSGFSFTGGKPIARVGDQITCPKKGHGHITVIVSGDATMTVDGQAVARHGDKCACGATLLSSQMVTFVDAGAAASAGQRSTASLALPVNAPAAAPGTVTFDYDEQVELDAHAAVAEGLPYYIRVSDGRVLSGRVDGSGLLPRVDTPDAATYEVVVGDEALALIEGAV